MADLAKAQKEWYVIIAKVHYKKAGIILERLGISYYLPLQRQLRYWSDRTKWINVPILAPYIFLYTNEVERKLIFQSCNVFHFLNYKGKPAIAKEDEIQKVKLLCVNSSQVKIELPPIKKGDLVEVIAGPFSGMSGYTLKENGKDRFLIHMLSLNQFASIDIDSSWLRTC